MSYRLINASRLDDATADALVRFAWERVPGGIDKSTAIKLRDPKGHDYPNGMAMHGRAVKWAGRATHAIRVSVPSDQAFVLGGPRVCWHSTQIVRYQRTQYGRLTAASGQSREERNEIATWRTYDWIAGQHAAGQTHIGSWPIYITNTAEEAVVHTLAHELMHVLATDRERGKQSELLCEEFALQVLTAYQAEKEEAA